ncbi:hypothetical protein [Burkholderia sp. BE17]|uniref:hypothetical protein n=1 Tax=Burkholderia sp. BE17 TaxID=2656644 RepID=UPI00128B469F|nr:hypothetical protein [Burkholderia sp. BE17]MPV71174.1 hypothetical protein [Burkholderia sp. BE17]
MNTIFVLTLKTVLLTVVMYLSVSALGCSPIVSMVLASIPLVFMMLSVYTGFAFRLVAFVFLVACAKTLIVGENITAKQATNALRGAAGEVNETLRAVRP